MSRAWQRTFVLRPGGTLEAAIDLEDGALTGTLGDEGIGSAAVRRIDERVVALRTRDGWVRALVFRKADVTYVAVGGDVYELREAEQAGAAAAADHEELFATSPMTGVVVKVTAAPGDEAAEGQELVVVEAMKMEYVVRAPRDVVIDGIEASEGQSVEFGQVLVTFREPE